MSRIAAVILFLGALCPGVARAQVFVKTSAHKAVPVRVSALRADVEIVGAIAITHWKLNVQMENLGDGGGYFDNGGVSEWIMARPIDAKVTAFRADDGRGGLVGHVVEKAVAAPLVSFPAAPDDPLLRSGLNARNSLRATIYPLGSWREVTVSGTWVQVLDAKNGRFNYRLPLLSMRGATTRLAQINASIRVRGNVNTRLENNYGLPTQTENGGRVLGLHQKNYRVTRDWSVSIPRVADGDGALVTTPDADKKGGHFALALSGDVASSAKLHGRGLAEEIAVTRVGTTTLFTGTYRGELGQISPTLSDKNNPRSLNLLRLENPVGAALWATQKINALSKAPAQRAAVIALSKTYDVASPFTTWLTVSDQDLKFYRRALVDDRLDSLVREYWIRVSDGQEKSARAAQLKSAIGLVSRANGLVEKDELYTRLGSAYDYVLWQKYGSYYPDGAKKPNQTKVKARIARLGARQLAFVESLTGKKVNRSVDWASPIYGGELADLRGKIMNEYRQPHPDYAQLEKWQHRFALLYGSTNIDPRLRFWRAQIKAHELETQTVVAEKAGNQTKLTQLDKERRDNSRNAYFVNNIGDPPIYVSAPADARLVVAVMPDGQVKTLDYNAVQKRWEGNYDVPNATNQGDYSIQIVIVNADQTRRRYAMRFRVDTTPPQGVGQVLAMPGDSQLLLQVEHGGDVARVTALLPWGEKVALLPSTQEANRFWATARAPRAYAGKTIRVTYILIDRAHNLTSIEAESVVPLAAQTP